MVDIAGLDFSGLPGVILSILIGLCLGSFATALVWRIPRGQAWALSRGRIEHSACPSCHHRLGIPDLVPVLSWAALRGRCRYCRAAIGWRYPAIELLTLLLCVTVNITSGITVPGFILMLAMPFLVALVAIDFEHMILPNQINLILWILGLGFAFAQGGGMQALSQALISSIVYAALSFATGWVVGGVLKKEAMGFGDVKFFAVAGLWLGVSILPAFLFLSGIVGIAMGLFWKKIRKTERFPFGPALIVAFLLCLIFVKEISALLY